jgi:hypothetical protein
MKNIVLGLLCILFYTACSDVLDKKDLSAVTDAWNEPLYATAYLNKLYRDNSPGWDNSISANSDESVGGGGILYGQLTTASINHWPYDQIRKINLLISEIDGSTIDTETRALLKAQAQVLRAWRYFEMVRLYGGVPLILKPQSLSDDLYVTRNKTSECISAIVKDLDDAIDVLPWKWTDNDAGRISKASALALKGRVLLFYASPQYNRPNRNAARWEEAYAVNKLAKEELEKNGYGLYERFENIWFDEMNKEAIFVTRYEYPEQTNNWNAATRPLEESQNASGSNHPIVELVDAFPMKTGVPTSESPDFDPVLYWKNRDPRFTSTIAYNGCIWELSGKSGRRQWTFFGSEVNYPSNTGYYCRKAINPSYIPLYAEKSSTDWIEIRYAEVMLNYAECAAETGKMDEAYQMLKLIRQRAGIEPGSNNMYGLKENMSYEEMIKAIMLERRIELAFEGKRYWDLRRRMLFESELNGTRRHARKGILLISQGEFDNIRYDTSIDFETNYAQFFRDSVYLTDLTFDINHKPEYYFYAIPNSHLEANSKLQQTQGWDNGTFNPLE